MAPSLFFETQTDSSQTKSYIVAEYFRRWSEVFAPQVRSRGECLQYIDLFAGPGVYDDGSESTPVLILKAALARGLHDILACSFNDADPGRAASLERAIRAIPGVAQMRHPPKVFCQPVDERVTELLRCTALPPTLTFLDPFGYKGLSNRLIQAALKDFGCEVIFFFNYNRVNPGISNDDVAEHMEALFDVGDAVELRGRLLGLGPRQREQAVMALLEETLRRRGYARHIRHFTFLNQAGSRTSHRIVFATKNPLGAKIMKEVMASAGGWEDRGVPLYRYGGPQPTPSLFDPLADLEEMLLRDLAGRTLSAGEVYLRHGLDLPYTEKNYKTALKRLESQGKVACRPCSDKRRLNTFSDTVAVSFPIPGVGGRAEE
jgi:three-Cys-motif partner protein